MREQIGLRYPTTRRGEVTGPSTWDGYAAAAVCEAGVRSLEEGGRVAVELAEKPPLYR
jgi:myo-inositol 2-dehydrogenase/D-chiro-inositol 1-dehydrogenase